MGSYATLYTFKLLLDESPVNKEWERPRIIIDNVCHLPSRVRSILYGESTSVLIEGARTSIQNLIHCGAEIIIIPCNTMHYYYEEICHEVPHHIEILNMIDLCMKQVNRNCFIIASEGTISTKIYDRYKQSHIEIRYPSLVQQTIVREIIEAVKTDSTSEPLIKDNVDALSNSETECTILGCTELSVISNLFHDRLVIDPLKILVTETLKKANYRKPDIKSLL